MRIHTGKKPAPLQVLLECSHPTNLVCNENLILTILMVTCTQFLHCHENTYWWIAYPTTGAGRSYALTKHGCNDKNNFHCPDGGMHSVSLVTCGYILVRNLHNYGSSQGLSLHQTQLFVIYFQRTYGDMCSVATLPWEHILVWNLHDCRCFQNIYLSYKQNCSYWKTYSCSSESDIHCHENPHW